MPIKVDLPEVGVKTPGRYVTIPSLDLLDMPHPGVRLNSESYDAGQTYFLDSERATTIEDALRGYEAGSRRIFQPRQDANAIRDVERGSGKPLVPFTSAT